MRLQYLLLAVFSILCLHGFAQKKEINKTLAHWHKAAAEANFEDYFSAMAPQAIFIGTDPTEHWTKKEFMTYAKPYFDKGKAWSFSSLERFIYHQKDENIAWFDELLTTQMGLCRGSGVVEKINGQWKIKHYVLSISIPNEDVSEVVQLKKSFEENFIKAKKTD